MAPLPGYKASVFVSTGVSTPTTNEAMTDKGDHATFFVTNGAHRYLDPTVTPVVQEELDEIQTITITGSPTGGTFTLVWNGQTTAALNWNATAAQVQTALQNLSNVGANNCTVTGGPGPSTAFTAEFTGTLGFAAQALITRGTDSLTGGSSPDVSITRAQAGQAWTTLNSGYTLQFCGGIVFLTTAALSAGVGVRLSTANYLVVSQALQATSIDVQVQADIADISTLGGGVWKQKMVLLGDATVKLSQWWIDVFYLTNLGNLLVLVAQSGANANQQLACYGYLKTNGHKMDPKSVQQQTLDFESHGPILAILS